MPGMQEGPEKMKKPVSLLSMYMLHLKEMSARSRQEDIFLCYSGEWF